MTDNNDDKALIELQRIELTEIAHVMSRMLEKLSNELASIHKYNTIEELNFTLIVTNRESQTMCSSVDAPDIIRNIIFDLNEELKQVVPIKYNEMLKRRHQH